MSLMIVYMLVMTILIGNSIFAIETAAFMSAKSALDNALVALSVNSIDIINQIDYAINQDQFKILVENQLSANYQYLSLEIEFYFYNQATMQSCNETSATCDGVQIRITSYNSYFEHQAEVRFEVSFGG